VRAFKHMAGGGFQHRAGFQVFGKALAQVDRAMLLGKP
jgi:hypothetical protein